MAQLPAQAVKEFAEMYKREFGIDLAPEEATRRAHNFLRLYVAVLSDNSTEVIGNDKPP